MMCLYFISFVHTVSYLSVHIGVSNGFPTQPLLGNSTRLNCSVTPYPQLNYTFLTIQYQWYTNRTLRGSGQELMLTNLSPADATTYSCVVTIYSSSPTLLIRQISNQSTYELTTKSGHNSLCYNFKLICMQCFFFHYSSNFECFGVI